MTTRPALPQDYMIGEGAQFDDFETVGDYTIQNGAWGALSADSDHYKTGTKSLKLDVTSGGRNVGAKKTISKKFDPETIFSLWVYIPDPTITYAVNVAFSSVAISGTNPHALIQLLVANVARRGYAGWNRLTWTASDMALNYGESWDNTMIQSMVSFVTLTDQVGSVSVDNLRYDEVFMPRIMLVFDDVLDGVYTLGYPIMAAKGIPGTMYCTKDWVGVGSHITLPHLQELYAAGWAASNHSTSHPNFTTLSYEEIVAEITECSDWLDANGMPRASRHLAYPHNAWSEDVITAVRATCLTGAAGGEYCFWPNAQNWLMPRASMYETASLSGIYAHIDRAKKYGQSLILYTHNIEESPAVGNTSPSRLQAIVDYIDASRIRCVTIDEWYNGLTNPRYRSLPVTRAVA